MADPNLAALNRVILDGIHESRSDLDYTPSYFIRMLSEMGPVEAVRHLVTAPSPSDGFTRLWEHDRLDLSVESVALRPEFSSLFGDIADTARHRLAEYGFTAGGVTEAGRRIAGSGLGRRT